MSAPDTDTEHEAEQHRVPIIGIAATLVFAFFIAVAVMGVMNEAAGPAAPDDATAADRGAS